MKEIDIGVLEESALAMAQSTIQNVINESRLSKSDLARRMQIGRSGVTRMLSGSHNLTIKTMAKALALCGHEVRFEAVPIVWNWQSVPQPSVEVLPANAGSDRSGLLNEAYCPRFIEAHWYGWLPTTFVPQPTPAEPRIETQPQIILSERDQQIVLDAIENPPEPNAALKRAFGAQPEPEERHRAEDAYTISAFDYQRDPVGSRDWELFWRGWRARAGSSLIVGVDNAEGRDFTGYHCLTCGPSQQPCEHFPSPPSSPGAAQTGEKLCGHEFKLKDGYFCELPHGHAGGHEATCPNPQFHQSWPNETADMCNKCQDEHEGFLDECECKCHRSPGAPQEQK